jgi:hypothetical protein
METTEHIEKVEPPIGLAGGVCALCLVATFLAISIISRFMDIRWMNWFFAVSIPLSVTFVVLYRSSWHREQSKMTRILSMILSACIIYTVVLVIEAFGVVLASFIFAGNMVAG